MMDQYLQQLISLIHADNHSIEGIMIINKQGIIEYYKNMESDRKWPEIFEKNVIGRQLLSVYPQLTEESSTVMRTLRTGKITKGERQILTTGNMLLDFTSTTYPILDESGEVQGAAEIIHTVGNPRLLTPQLNIPQHEALDRIITCNETMRVLKNRTNEIAKTDSPVLIYGETGTGKELFAEALHAQSFRKDGPFIAQNCAAIPETLLESLFFGTEKGGFTGAESKKGLFELADKGTLFLDEINSMDVSIQAKLLKALEQKTARRIGGRDSIPFDIRIICASNENPEKLLHEGRMRSDFYYRVGVVQLYLPPLRERMEDILPLTDHFIRHYNQKMGKDIQGLSSMTKDIFLQWHWPGNVRELKNVVESAFNTENSAIITLDSIPELLSKLEQNFLEQSKNQEQTPFSIPDIQRRLQQDHIDLRELLEDYERAVIQAALCQCRKLSEAAKKLSISPQKLRYRMEKLGITLPV